MPDMHEILGRPDEKESYNFKAIAKYDGKYHIININTYVYQGKSLL